MLAETGTLEAQTNQTITGEELLAMGDIGRCELVEGYLVMLHPNGGAHGSVVANVSSELAQFTRPRKLGSVRTGEVGIYTHRNPDTVRGADVLFISNERLARLKSPGYMDVAPELIVEVMSPEDSWSKVTKKLEEYFEIGVRVVIVADPDDRRLFVYRALTQVQILNSQDTLTIEDVLPGFSVPVSALFEGA
jgi:Uma2 family endonuclease